jgi:hypothetical protein
MNYTVVFDAGRSSHIFMQITSSGGVRYAFPAVTALLLVAAGVLIARRHRLDKRVLALGLVALVVVRLFVSK